MLAVAARRRRPIEVADLEDVGDTGPRLKKFKNSIAKFHPLIIFGSHHEHRSR
jgi:hypothetical protein